MKTTRLLLAALASTLLLSQCVTPMVARNNGAKVNWPHPIECRPGEPLEWTGEKDAEGFATGKGKVVRYGPDGRKNLELECACVRGTLHGPYVWREFKHGKVDMELCGTFANGLRVGEYEARYFQAASGDDSVTSRGCFNAQGRMHGQAESRSLNGSRTVQQWSNGSYLSSTKYNPDGSVRQPVAVASSSSSSSSSYSDTDLVGGLFALGGLAGGDANLLMGGVSMMAGDDAGAMQHISNVGSGGGSTGGLTGAAGGGSAAPKRIVANKPDLISQYGLARFRSAEGDHIKFYIDSADRAYADYKKTGEEQYYTRHREYADTALQFHKQTSTQGTRMIR